MQHKNGNRTAVLLMRERLKKEMLETLPGLRAFAISLCGNVDRAEDLVQEAFLRGIANLHSFEPGTNMSAWLFTILRNHFRSEYRKRRREVEDADGHYAESLTVNPGQEHALDLEQMLMYLACLPVEQSDALIAVAYLGMSYEEAAERLECAIGTVKSRVNRARMLLPQLMEETVVNKVDLARLKHATQGIPKNHPYYPIAEAYVELYSDSLGVSSGHTNGSHDGEISKKERAWQELVASGALDHEQGADDMPDFLQNYQ
jgi:RNA polymerase sigma-70 factor (ECF subfamily)